MYFDRYFVSALLDIITRDTKIEYIDSYIFRIDTNYIFANKTSNIFIVDINKQLQTDCLTILSALLSNLYICLLLDLVPKYNNNWKYIYNLFFSKNIFVNNSISRDREALEYVVIDNTIAALIAQERETVFFKKNLADVFRHITMAIFDR